MDDSALTDHDITDLFGGEAGPVKVNEDELAVAQLLADIRSQLADCASRLDIGVNQLARRLDVSPSSVSRFFSSEADARISTIVLYARAMGQACAFFLSQGEARIEKGNYPAHPEISYLTPVDPFREAASPYIHVVDFSRRPSATARLLDNAAA